MPCYMYVSVQDDDKILVFTMDEQTGKLTPESEAPVGGGPSLLAISPNREVLYVGHRGSSEISSWRIDQATGGLAQNGKVSTDDPAAYLSTDRKGRYLLSS